MFLTRVLACYGKPSRVRVDRGREFAGEFAALMSFLGVQIILTAVHSPWTNGIAERMVKFVKDLMKKVLVGMSKGAWPEMVPWVQAAINLTVSRSTGHSPFEVFFGEEGTALLPGEVGAAPLVAWG